MLRPVCVMILAFSAAACGSGSDTNERAPASTILARSASDDMLPLETVQSQAPLAKPDSGVPPKKGAKEGGDQADAPVGEGEDTIAPWIETPPPPTDTIGAAISGQSAPDAR